MKRLFLLTFATLLLTNCSRDLDLQKLENKSPEEIMKMGKSEMEAKRYSDAVQIFEELERLYPYSKLTAEAQLNAGDCNYTAKKYDEASSSYEIFVKTHPTHNKVPYAIYMLGKINFEQIPIIERDQEVTANSLSYFTELCKRYPKSEYIKEAEEKIKFLKQQMAAREVYVARYYQRRHNYAAAVGRLNTVVDLYYTTDHAPEALHRLVECYVAMGFFEEAKTVHKVLQKEYPKTQWAEYSKRLLESYTKTK
jgi:outer membrane protein assembly factor BamD